VSQVAAVVSQVTTAVESADPAEEFDPELQATTKVTAATTKNKNTFFIFQ